MLKIICLGILLMAQQVGVQSGAKVGIHNHSTISQGGVIVTELRIVGAGVSIANVPAKNTNSVGFVKVKEITIMELSPGTCTIYYTLSRTAGAGAVNGRLYINGSSVGVDNASNPGPDIWNDVLALDLVVGDKIQIYAHGTGANTATVENMEIRYSNSLRTISSHTLITPLPSAYIVPIANYNSDP